MGFLTGLSRAGARAVAWPGTLREEGPGPVVVRAVSEWVGMMVRRLVLTSRALKRSLRDREPVLMVGSWMGERDEEEGSRYIVSAGNRNRKSRVKMFINIFTHLLYFDFDTNTRGISLHLPLLANI
jgi:hypothetical protein